MKRIIALLSLVVITVSCETGLENNQFITHRSTFSMVKGIDFKSSEWDVAEKNLSFDINLFKEAVASNGIDNSDELVSPLSVSLAFTMLSAAANGDTRREIIDALGYNNLDYSDISSYYSKLSKDLLSLDDDITLSIANAFWPAGSYGLNSNFVEEAKKTFGIEIHPVDYDDPASAAEIINNWTSEKTNGHIDRLFNTEYITIYTKAILENVLYFKGAWMTPFLINTEQRQFTTINNEKDDHKFFWSKTSALAYFDKEVSVIKIPYGKGAFCMTIVLPSEKKEFSAFFNDLTAKKWNKWSGLCKYANIEYHIPCFESSSNFNGFNDIMRNLGIKTAFSNGDFSNLADEPLILQSVHRTKIAVTESGTEAAATTGDKFDWDVANLDTVDFIPFIADRPFVYAIEEASTGTLLFIGTHVN